MRSTLVILGLIAALAIVGCSRRPADMPALFPCSVTVVNRGVAIPGAQVQLVQGRDGTTLAAVPISIVGETKANGVAILHTNRLGARYQEKGVPAGTYLVSVEKLPEWDGRKSAEDMQRMTSDQVMAYLKVFEEAVEKLPRDVPKALSRHKKQPLEVVAGQGAALTIDVAQFQE